MMMDGSISRMARDGARKMLAPPSFRSSRATAVMTTCLSFIRRTASATRSGSSSSSAKGFAVVTAQNPQARVQRSPGDHHGGGALAPAFPAIWALRALANGVQTQIGNERLGREKDRIRWQPDFDPGRFLRLVQSRIDFRAGHRRESF